MKLTHRGRMAVALALSALVVALLMWAAVKDATFAQYQAECSAAGSCPTP